MDNRRHHEMQSFVDTPSVIFWVTFMVIVISNRTLCLTWGERPIIPAMQEAEAGGP